MIIRLVLFYFLTKALGIDPQTLFGSLSTNIVPIREAKQNQNKDTFTHAS